MDFIDEMKKIKYEMVSFDHTFNSASNIVTVTDSVVKKQFKSLILIINEVGLIGRYAFLKNEGLVDMIPILQEIGEDSKPSYTMSDKCCDEWKIVQVHMQKVSF